MHISVTKGIFSIFVYFARGNESPSMIRKETNTTGNMSAKKMKLTSASHSDFTLEALRQIAPSAFTEVRGEHGELTHKVDFEALKELFGDNISNSNAERFGFYWVGKQDAKRAAAEPTCKTLRPIVEGSVDWDNTQNLYIEGDNLEVLKLLQRAYLGKVKMIYIDPPYNTGNDFVYLDDFSMSQEKYDKLAGNVDAEGKRLRANVKTHARYHSDWCSMLYSRLLVARSLLTQDGVIFISIDDNEVHHLRMICDEVFGASNFVGQFTRVTKKGGKSSESVAKNHDFIVVYAKQKDVADLVGVLHDDDGYSLKDDHFEERGYYKLNQTLDYSSLGYVETLDYPITIENETFYPGGDKDAYHRRQAGNHGRADWCWRWSKELYQFGFEHDFIVLKRGQERPRIYTKTYQKVKIEKEGKTYAIVPIDRTKALSTLEFTENVYSNDNAKKRFNEIMHRTVFEYTKPTSLITKLMSLISDSNSLILDFFSGSATTAHAVMQLNAEDGGKRKYICVQLPEETPEGSEARKAGYDTICKIGKERIRRAGEDILGKLYTKREEILSNFARFAIGEDVDKDPELWQYIEDEATREQAKQELAAINERIQNLDTGFRVLHVDTSNMEELYFEPSALQQKLLFKQVNSVKKKRSDLDLLFGCMVDWGVELSYPLRQEEVAGKHLHIVNDGALVACFEEDIDLEVIRTIAKLEPLRVLFRESCFASDADKLNIYELFKQLCGWSAEESYRRIHVM